MGGLDLNSSNSGCARLGSGVVPPLGVVEKEVAVLIACFRSSRRSLDPTRTWPSPITSRGVHDGPLQWHEARDFVLRRKARDGDREIGELNTRHRAHMRAQEIQRNFEIFTKI